MADRLNELTGGWEWESRWANNSDHTGRARVQAVGGVGDRPNRIESPHEAMRRMNVGEEKQRKGVAQGEMMDSKKQKWGKQGDGSADSREKRRGRDGE